MSASGAKGGRVGVCSWSLRPCSVEALLKGVGACGLDAVQLALDPIRRGEWDEAEVVERLRSSGISVLSGMMAMAGEDYSTLAAIERTGGVAPDETWAANRAAAVENAAIARRLGIGLVTFHAGRVPGDRADPRRAETLRRIRVIGEMFAEAGVRIAFETGQDSARDLVETLEELADLEPGVNFDPANMLLYGSDDPIGALRRLSVWVRQAHIKDAKPPARRGQWGEEVRAGEGSVDWRAFFETLRERAPGVDMVIEREAGDDRVGDVIAAARLVRAMR